MKTRERRNWLLAQLEDQKHLTIAKLAAELNISSMTIRRDCQRLVEMGLAVPVYGGIAYVEGGATLPTLKAREQYMLSEKNSIASYCASMITEGNAIYLDAGSTVMSIANALSKRKDIAVLSHSLPIQNLLAGSKGIQLFGVPGIYHTDTRGYFGDLTCRFIRGFRLDIAFLGSSSVNAETGLTSPDPYDQALKRTLVETARKVVLAVDHTKINHETFLQVCDLKAIDQIITDKKADATFIDKARQLGVKVVQI